MTVAIFWKWGGAYERTSKIYERRSLLQNADIIVLIVILAPVLIAFLGLIEASVKLIDTIVKARSSRSKSKKNPKKMQKK